MSYKTILNIGALLLFLYVMYLRRQDIALVSASKHASLTEQEIILPDLNKKWQDLSLAEKIAYWYNTRKNDRGNESK